MKKIIISEACEACGACFSSTPLIVEAPNGKACPANGGVCTDEESKSLGEVMEMCPVHAISLTDGGYLKGTKDVGQIEKVIHDKLSGFRGHCPVILLGEINYIPSIDYPDSVSSYYVYGSSTKAEDAALEVFRRTSYARKGHAIQEVLSRFKTTYLTPLMRYEEREDNFYYSVDKQITDFLKAISAEIYEIFDGKKKIPDDLQEFRYPYDNEFNWLESVIDHYDKIISDAIEPYFEYRAYVKTNDTVIYEGRREKTKWNYDILYLLRRFVMDVKSEFHYRLNDIKEEVSNYVSSYNEKLQQLLEKREKQIFEILEGHDKSNV